MKGDPDRQTGSAPYEGPGSIEMWVGEATRSPTRKKSREFALSIISLYQQMRDEREFVISKQLLRCGTSIGANVEEAIAAESRRDFLHKMAIASKEARETVYWLGLLDESHLVADLDVSSHLEQAQELVRLLTSIVKTTRESAGQP
jgi:four helix bundle protein